MCLAQMEDRVEDLLQAGVLDPAKVTRSGLMNACGIAGIMLTTQVHSSFCHLSKFLTRQLHAHHPCAISHERLRHCRHHAHHTGAQQSLPLEQDLVEEINLRGQQPSPASCMHMTHVPSILGSLECLWQRRHHAHHAAAQRA